MPMVNMQNIRNRVNAVLVKQVNAEFLNDQQMLDQVRDEKLKIIAEVALSDSIIRTRFNDLLQHH